MRIEPSELPAPESCLQRVIGRPFGAPVDGFRIDLLARAVEDPDLGPREIARIALHPGDDFFLDDRDRDRPGRIEVDDLNLGGNLRRGMLRVADDGDIVVNDAAVLDRLDRGRGQIDHDIALVERKIEPRQAIGARGELIEAFSRRNVHRLQRRSGDDARLAQPHMRLEAFHRRRQARVPREAARLRGVQIALDHEPLAQLRHRRTRGSRADRDDVGRPAAGVDDRRIAFGSLGCGEEGLGLKRRRRIVAERGFARRRGRGDFFRLRRRRSLDRNRRGRGRRGARRRLSPHRCGRRDVRRRQERAHQTVRRGRRARRTGRRRWRGRRSGRNRRRLRQRAGNQERQPDQRRRDQNSQHHE